MRSFAVLVLTGALTLSALGRQETAALQRALAPGVAAHFAAR